MTIHKRRLTVTVDPDLIEAGNEAVSSGRADSLSGWVTTALAEKVARDAKFAALGDAIADYEAEFGNVTTEEIATQVRADRASATIVRGKVAARPSRKAPSKRSA